MLECSMISRSDTSGESGCRGNGSMSLDQANDPNVQKYACARCGRSYLHQVFNFPREGANPIKCLHFGVWVVLDQTILSVLRTEKITK
jgi:hypothetical protein